MGGAPDPQAGTRLVQAVVRLGAMSSVVRVAHWLDLHMELVVRCRPAVFTALAVVDRLAADGAEDWGLVQPLLVAAALHPVATCSPGRCWSAILDLSSGLQIVFVRSGNRICGM